MARLPRAQQWLSLLQTLTADFSRALTPLEVAQVIVERAKPAVGAHLIACVLLTDDGQALETLTTAGISGSLLNVYGRVPLDSPVPLAEMARTGEPIWIETQAEYIRRYPTMAEILREQTKTHAMAALPLSANNQLIGGLGVSFARPRNFSSSERSFFVALAQQCAQAIDRSRVYAQERQAREAAEAARARMELLQGIVSELVKAQSVAQIAEIFLTQVLPVVGAYYGSISLLSEDRTQLEFIGIPRLPSAVVQANPTVPMDLVSPGTDAVRTQHPIWIENQQQYGEIYPHRIKWLRANVAMQAGAYLPLVIENDVIGGMALGFEQSRDFSAEERKFLLTVAGQCAQALDRARAYEAERAARLRAEESDRLKTQFIAMISHELRTPLTSILGFSSTLTSETFSDPVIQRRFVGIIDEEAQRMKVLVDQLIDLSRLQGGIMELDLEAMQLDKLIAGIEEQLRLIAAEHTLRIAVPADLPPVQADRQRVEQVLFNLVGNAALHAPPGTPIKIDVRAEVQDNRARIEVIDEGAGIPETEREQVFQPFKQLPQHKPTARKGLGLGLTICRALVEAHGGAIWIEGHQPQGTRVVFTLPLA